MKVEYDCEICGKHKTGYRSRPAAHRLCSYECKALWMVKHRKRFVCNLPHPSGEQHPRWRSERERKCLRCGDMFCLSAAGRFRGQKFCSGTCAIRRREENPRWSGGPEGRKARGARSRSCVQQRDWSRAVLRRDDYTCQFCGKRGGDLHADHINPFAEYPEFRWELSNGRTLCKPCHYTTFRRSQKTA